MKKAINTNKEKILKDLSQRNQFVGEINELIETLDYNVTIEKKIYDIFISKLESFISRKLKYKNVSMEKIEKYVKENKHKSCVIYKDFEIIMKIYNYLKDQLLEFGNKKSGLLVELKKENENLYNRIVSMTGELFDLDIELAPSINLLISQDEDFKNTASFATLLTCRKYDSPNIDAVIKKVYDSFGIDKEEGDVLSF